MNVIWLLIIFAVCIVSNLLFYRRGLRNGLERNVHKEIDRRVHLAEANLKTWNAAHPPVLRSAVIKPTASFRSQVGVDEDSR